MKKSFLSLLLTTGAIATLVTFHACSSDETSDPQPMSKSQLLLKKSKEFAQKYNVDLEVDETQLEKVADTLSVEQMERDYQAWAKLQNAPINILPNQTKSANGLKLTKRRATFESTSISEHIDGYVNENPNILYSITYNFGNDGNGMVRVWISYYGSEGFTYLQPLGYSIHGTNRCSFTAHGPITLSGTLYHVTYQVWVDHDYTGKTTVTLSHL